MGEYKKVREWAFQQIVDNRVYVESVGKKIGNQMHYDLQSR